MQGDDYTVGTMATLVALLKGINVGGRNRLSMKDLAAILVKAGTCDVKTCIQSGNAVFQSNTRDHAALARTVTSGIKKAHGFEPRVLVLGMDVFIDAMQKNPFPEAEATAKTLHLGFLASPPAHPDIAKLDDLRKDSERFRLIDSVFYLHAPEGVGRSKLAATAEKLLGVPMTVRNWNTVCRIRDLTTAEPIG